MIKFETLNDMFENQKDFYLMFNTYGDDATRYALLRSLDNNNIKCFLEKKIDVSVTNDLLKNAYNSEITIDEIVNYIMSKKEEILKWLGNGAQPSDTVKNILSKEGVIKEFAESKKAK